MIVDAKEMEMDREELLAELYMLSAKKEELTREISRSQQKVTDVLSGLLDKEQGEGEDAAGLPGCEVVSYLHEYTEKNTDVSDQTSAAALVMLLRFAEDNKDMLGLSVPPRMSYSALSMRLPDMMGTEELEDWCHKILSACGAAPGEDTVPESTALYCTDSSRDAILGNLFQMVEAYDTGDEEGRISAVGFLYQLMDFALQRNPGAGTETLSTILNALLAGARRAGDAMVEEAALKSRFEGRDREDRSLIREAMRAVSSLEEELHKAEQRFDRLLGLL